MSKLMGSNRFLFTLKIASELLTAAANYLELLAATPPKQGNKIFGDGKRVRNEGCKINIQFYMVFSFDIKRDQVKSK